MTKGYSSTEVNFEDLVDLEKIRKTFEHFYEVNKLSNAIVDPKGKVLFGCGWQDICTNFHRAHDDTIQKCRESDEYISRHLNEGKFLEYKCKNGLWDAAYPIIVNGRHLAAVFVGQFFYEGESPDRELFIQQARDCGFDQEKYLKALDNVPRFSRSFVKKTLEVYVDIATMLTEQGFIKLKLKREIAEHKKQKEDFNKMQEVLIEAEKLASIGALVAEITHQINNPLQIITGRAQLGLMDELQDKETEENYRIILEEGMKTKEIVERLLKFSKPSKGKTAEADINAVIEEIIRLIEPQYALVRIEIIRKFSSSLPGIEIDERQIQEVLLNLMNNAAQSMPDGGVITIATMHEPDNIKIKIIDTGRGISEINLRRLFEPFFTTKEKGTGLGLPVCYGIVKSHGGKITFKSKEGEGTTVTVTLPLKT